MTDTLESLRQQLVHEKWLREQSENFCAAVQDQRDSYKEQLADANSQCELSYAGIRSLEQKLAESQARERVLRDAMLAVLCDPEGTPCFDGSDGDREVIAAALKFK